MKKLLKLLLVLTLAFFAFGCGSEDNNEDTNNNEEQEQVERNEDYEPASDEPNIAGLIVMEIRSEGETMTIRYSSQLSEENALSEVRIWANENEYTITDQPIIELIDADEIDKTLINVNSEANYEDFEGDTMIEIVKFN